MLNTYTVKQLPVSDNRGISGVQWAVVRQDGQIMCCCPNATMQTDPGKIITLKRDFSAFNATLLAELLNEWEKHQPQTAG